jgi:hypothetical protein
MGAGGAVTVRKPEFQMLCHPGYHHRADLPIIKELAWGSLSNLQIVLQSFDALQTPGDCLGSRARGGRWHGAIQYNDSVGGLHLDISEVPPGPPQLGLHALSGNFIVDDIAAMGAVRVGNTPAQTRRVGGGAGYQWTRKVAGKTVTVALNCEQFKKMIVAIANRRKLNRIIDQMEKLSRHILFEQNPHGARRKRLSNKVLGLN